MTVASGTATRAELVALKKAVYNLNIMLRQYDDGSAGKAGTVSTYAGRFTPAEIDTQISAVSTAITAVNA
jgi:hypothetical protein